MNYLKTYSHKFYKSKLWTKKRKEILIRDNFECQLCKAQGKVSKAKVVHHIKYYDKYPQLGITDENLISVCSSCHNKLHPEKGFNGESNLIHEERWE